MIRKSILALVAAAALGVAGAGSSVAGDKKLKGDITCDGSSTVYLITKAMASNFRKLHPDVSINIGIAGTGGGFRKFANGDVDICDASRKIKEAEAAACKAKGVEYIELQVAWDGLAVVIHKDNNFATKLTMAQLKKIWDPNLAAKTWKDVDPKFPNEPFGPDALWGAGKDSGTFDYFTEAVNGKERVIRQDYNGSEDDNVIVTGVSKNKFAMGFFGVAYYTANKNKLNVVALAAKEGEPYYEPTKDNVLSGKYPISRPLFIYVTKKSLARPEVLEFVRFYQARPELTEGAGYVGLDELQQLEERDKLKKFIGK